MKRPRHREAQSWAQSPAAELRFKPSVLAPESKCLAILPHIDYDSHFTVVETEAEEPDHWHMRGGAGICDSESP